jgi:hypothetical protein
VCASAKLVRCPKTRPCRQSTKAGQPTVAVSVPSCGYWVPGSDVGAPRCANSVHELGAESTFSASLSMQPKKGERASEGTRSRCAINLLSSGARGVATLPLKDLAARTSRS